MIRSSQSRGISSAQRSYPEGGLWARQYNPEGGLWRERGVALDLFPDDLVPTLEKFGGVALMVLGGIGIVFGGLSIAAPGAAGKIKGAAVLASGVGAGIAGYSLYQKQKKSQFPIKLDIAPQAFLSAFLVANDGGFWKNYPGGSDLDVAWDDQVKLLFTATVRNPTESAIKVGMRMTFSADTRLGDLPGLLVDERGGVSGPLRNTIGFSPSSSFNMSPLFVQPQATVTVAMQVFCPYAPALAKAQAPVSTLWHGVPLIGTVADALAKLTAGFNWWVAKIEMFDLTSDQYGAPLKIGETEVRDWFKLAAY